MLQSRLGSFEGLRVADLFAGSGALGLEALSRGAGHALLIDNDRAAAEAIRRNLAAMGAAARADVLAQAVEYASLPSGPFDILFLDPPYASGLAEMALDRVANAGWVAPGGFVSLETDGDRPPPPPGFAVETERRFGKAFILLLRREGN
jgi:16S rRNA (guanine966-N2)-methyltransferase